MIKKGRNWRKPFYENYSYYKKLIAMSLVYYLLFCFRIKSTQMSLFTSLEINVFEQFHMKLSWGYFSFDKVICILFENVLKVKETWEFCSGRMQCPVLLGREATNIVRWENEKLRKSLLPKFDFKKCEFIFSIFLMFWVCGSINHYVKYSLHL